MAVPPRVLPIVPVLLALALVPSAMAEDGAPVLDDPAGDACVDLNPGDPVPGVLPCVATGGNTGALDVTRAWVLAPTPETIVLTLNVSASAPVSGAGFGAAVPMAGCQSVAADIQYTFHFRTRDPAGNALALAEPSGKFPLDDVYALAGMGCNSTGFVGGQPWEFFLAYGYTDDDGPASATFPIAGSFGGTTISWTIPRDHPLVMLPAGDAAGGHQVADLFAEARLGQTVAVAEGTSPADRGPDEGFGQPFVFPAVSLPTTGPTYHDVPLAEFTLASSMPTATSEAHVYNWTSAAHDIDLAYAADVRAGHVHVVVLDPDGDVVLDSTFLAPETDAFAVAGAPIGTWQVRIEYVDFVGDLRIDMAPAEPTPPAVPPPAPAPPTVDPTADDQATGGFPLQPEKDAPAAGPVPILLALALAFVGWRRRTD